MQKGNLELHQAICDEIHKLYENKNEDYGSSAHATFLEEGWASFRVRLSDKLNRFKTLTKDKRQKVNDESIRDTLIDLAGYSIMAIMELDFKKNITPIYTPLEYPVLDPSTCCASCPKESISSYHAEGYATRKEYTSKEDQ